MLKMIWKQQARGHEILWRKIMYFSFDRLTEVVTEPRTGQSARSSRIQLDTSGKQMRISQMYYNSKII
jgi:hypothetical protein